MGKRISSEFQDSEVSREKVKFRDSLFYLQSILISYLHPSKSSAIVLLDDLTSSTIPSATQNLSMARSMTSATVERPPTSRTFSLGLPSTPCHLLSTFSARCFGTDIEVLGIEFPFRRW